MTETARLLQDLVRLPSVNPMGRPVDEAIMGEQRVGAFLEAYFKNLNVRCERQSVAPRRDNVLAFLELPGARRALLLDAHQDTVPTDGMTVDPFGGVIENGRLYGRGACDVKGGMAAMLSAFARLAREKPSSACNVVLACTVDEEHTATGAQRLIQDESLTRSVEFAVVAEPTSLNVVRAHKGTVRWTLHVHGKSCHSSRPEQGVSAIYHAARLLPLIEEFAKELSLSRVDSLLGSATLSVGRIVGGSSVNTVPDHCMIEIDRRVIPGEEPRAVVGQLRDYLEETAPEEVRYELTDPWVSSPALSPAGSEELVKRLSAAIESVVGPREVLAVPYGTDACWLAQGGIPSVVMGPGDVSQAHTCDEWIDLEQLEQASEIYYRLITEW